MRASFVFSEVFTGLRRNITMTIAMVLTTMISLFLLGWGLLVVRTADQMQEQFYEQAQVSVYLTDPVSANDTTCSQALCAGLRTSLENNPAVKSVTFENREHVYQRFQKMFAAQPELVKLTRKQALPATLHVKLKDPTRSAAIVAEYAHKPGVQRADDQNKFLQKIFGTLNGVRNAVFVVALIQALAALLLIANTIQMSAFNRRTEVGIMRLVGATRWYTQLPFLLEALFAGVVGSILAIGLLFVTKSPVNNILAGPIHAGIVPEFSYLGVASVSPWLLLVAVVISVVTGYATLRMYVRL